MTAAEVSPHNPHKTRITCADAFNRERSISLWTAPRSGRIVLVAPPAEVALLTPLEARALRDRLDELAMVVEYQQAELHRVEPDGGR